jgi:hypothetical protein
MTAVSTTLVLGGARSGKSTFAERLVDGIGLTKVYLATATAGDDEMHARIAQHRKQRGEGWITVEEPLALVDALTREATVGRVVLVDCLTLWLSNLMFAERDPEIEAKRLVRFLDVSRYPIVSCPTKSASASCRRRRSAAPFAMRRAASTRSSRPPCRMLLSSPPGFRSGSSVPRRIECPAFPSPSSPDFSAPARPRCCARC